MRKQFPADEPEPAEEPEEPEEEIEAVMDANDSTEEDDVERAHNFITQMHFSLAMLQIKGLLHAISTENTSLKELVVNLSKELNALKNKQEKDHDNVLATVSEMNVENSQLDHKFNNWTFAVRELSRVVEGHDKILKK